MKLSEHFQVLRRAAKYTFSINRKYTVLLIVNSFLSSIIGYVPIYFSAKVIDSLIAKASVETVILYVTLTVGIVFAVNLLNTYISSEKMLHTAQCGEMKIGHIQKKPCKWLMNRLKIRRLRDCAIVFGVKVKRANLFYLYQHIEQFTGQVTKIIASIALTVSFLLFHPCGGFQTLHRGRCYHNTDYPGLHN